MGCDRCAKRLVCLYPWRRTVEGHALTGPLRSVRTYPRPLRLQSQSAKCGRREGCSGGSVAATPQKCPRAAAKRPPVAAFLHLSLTSAPPTAARRGRQERAAENRLPVFRPASAISARPPAPILAGPPASPVPFTASPGTVSGRRSRRSGRAGGGVWTVRRHHSPDVMRAKRQSRPRCSSELGARARGSARRKIWSSAPPRTRAAPSGARAGRFRDGPPIRIGIRRFAQHLRGARRSDRPRPASTASCHAGPAACPRVSRRGSLGNRFP